MNKNAILAMLLISPLAQAASFDCSKAASFAEKSICSSAELGALDDALASNYKAMLAADIGDGAKAELKATQKQWLAERNQCASTECLATSYRQRVDAICEYPVISGVHPGCTTASDIPASSAAATPATQAGHRCASEAIAQAQKLIEFHLGPDDRISVNPDVEALPPVKNPANPRQSLDVLEVWADVYKAQYRMRFLYAPVAGTCALVGQEILEQSSY